MEIKYNEQAIVNAEGKGAERRFVRLSEESPLSDGDLESAIEHDCSLTRADVKAVFTALRYDVAKELKSGHRVHIPGMGYFSLSAGLSKRGKEKKITGNDVWLKGINFLPEDSLLEELRKDISFIKSDNDSTSVNYTEEELWKRLEDYHAAHTYITCRDMREAFGLTDFTARKWLKLFVSEGRLKKEGNRRYKVYFFE